MRITLIIIVSLLTWNFVNAQNNLTLYNMKSLQQSLYVNPAHQIDYKFFLGVPALSSINLNINTRTLGVQDFNRALVENDRGNVSLNLRELTKNADQAGFVGFDFGLDLIHFGFKIGKTRISFNATEMVQLRVGIPTDALVFVTQGNGYENLGREFNFAPSIDFRHYREYGIGLQRQFLNDKLSIGVRPKLLVGFSNIETFRNNFSLTTSPNDFEWILRSDIGLNLSTVLGDAGDLENFQLNPITTRNILLGSKSQGAGLDFGASYDINQKFTVTASVVNLGFIRWNDNPMNLETRDRNATFSFKGADVNEFLVNDSFNTDILVDSIVNFLSNLDTSNSRFINTLFPNFYLGGNFNLTKNHSFGALMYGSYYNRMFNPALTLSYNGQIRNNLGLSISYSAIRGALVNVGAGLFVKLGPIQSYIVADNIIQTGGLDNFSLRMGTNIVILKDRKKKRKKD